MNIVDFDTEYDMTYMDFNEKVASLNKEEAAEYVSKFIILFENTLPEISEQFKYVGFKFKLDYKSDRPILNESLFPLLKTENDFTVNVDITAMPEYQGMFYFRCATAMHDWMYLNIKFLESCGNLNVKRVEK